MTEKPCPRCLLHELPDTQLFQTVRDYIDSLPDDAKAAPDVYEKRLALCHACDNLLNGMCRLCGCFVEARAAKRVTYCAKSKSIW